ncbi:transposase [Marinobacterium sedimentorum]|uniref:transposase n=1 Tax=Marinobacterium sedimentorum TaxID=2927804 RepID=UPI0034CF2AD7
MKHRHYTAELKSRIVTTCQQPGTSVAGAALDHGLNTNLVHKWIRTAQSPQSSTPSLYTARVVGPPQIKK